MTFVWILKTEPEFSLDFESGPRSDGVNRPQKHVPGFAPGLACEIILFILYFNHFFTHDQQKLGLTLGQVNFSKERKIITARWGPQFNMIILDFISRTH